MRADGRLLDLLAIHALEGLEQKEAGELGQLLRAAPGVELDYFEEAAAAVALAAAAHDLEELPSSLRQRIETEARQWSDPGTTGAGSLDGEPGH